MKLLNKDVYKTIEEAQKSWQDYCTHVCEKCSLKQTGISCIIVWLYAESDVDAPASKEYASVIAMREKIEILATEINMRNGDLDASICVDKAVSVLTSIRDEISTRESGIKELANGSH